MLSPARMSKTEKLVEGALMVALSFALSRIPHFSLPFGGSVSWFATLPILVYSLRQNWRWGFMAAAAVSLLQAMQGMNSIAILPTVGTMVLCALLDYILSYLCLGFCGPVARRMGGGTRGLICGIVFTGALRLIFSFISGITLWRSYAGDLPVWRYSLTYNASWCIPDVLLALIGALLLSRIPQLSLLQHPAKTGAKTA